MPCNCATLIKAMEVVTSCQCPDPGFCERHGVTKNPHLHSLCRRRMDYFLAWEEGRGPMQEKIPEEIISDGWGDRLAALILRVTFGWVRPCGGCLARKKWLNAIGIRFAAWVRKKKARSSRQ